MVGGGRAGKGERDKRRGAAYTIKTVKRRGDDGRHTPRPTGGGKAGGG